jgi:hypothetical protein
MIKRIDGPHGLYDYPFGLTKYTIMGHTVYVAPTEDAHKVRWLLGKVQANLRTYNMEGLNVSAR